MNRSRSSAIITSAGSRLTDASALTVMPRGRSPSSAVTTVTPVAKWPIAVRRSVLDTVMTAGYGGTPRHPGARRILRVTGGCMGQLTSDTERYREVVARYRGLIERSVGGVESIGEPEVSPNGQLVAVVVDILDGLEGRGHTELHLLTVDGTRRWQVTGAGVDGKDPRWSTGGTTLTFLADIGSRHRAAPFLLEVGHDGPVGEPRRLACPPGFPELQRPSPDGSTLLLLMAGEHAEVADGLGSGSVGELAAAAEATG